MSWTLHHNEVKRWAHEYQGEPFHALLCDPPYHLTSIVKRFGKPGAAPAQPGRDGAFQRASKGFMGKDWDGGAIAFDPELWYALGQHMYPGAFGMAFASSRGWHRLAVAIEDAGFIIHPSIFGWSTGSGFPKATRIDVQVDRDAGAVREVVGQRKHAPKFDAAGHGYREKDNGYNSKERKAFDETAPATDMAQDWQGHRYGLQALKPALEPIIVFQRPYEGRPVECITQAGAGALNIEAGRIGTIADMNPRDFDDSRRTSPKFSNVYQSGASPLLSRKGEAPDGRWPSNLVLIHTPACNGSCAPGCPVLALGAQSGESSSRQGQPRGAGSGAGWGMTATGAEYDDAGTAARFFYQADWALDVAEALDEADPVAYVAKASSRERNAGLESFGAATVGDGREKTNDTAYQRGATLRRNTHPTVKPIALARYLATLLLPPVRYGPRRILVPFAGTGSEMIGAHLAGWEEVHGIERDAEYVPINEARNRFWAGWKPEDATAAIAAWSAAEEAPATTAPAQQAMPLVFEDAA